MVVPDPDSSMEPGRKRQRLSLKAVKQKSRVPASLQSDGTNNNTSNNASKASPKQESQLSESSTTVGSSTCSNSSTSVTSDTSSSDSKVDMRVPPVASLENLGNTCFMNSIMQVLRYTPGFLHNLAQLYQEIQYSEKVKRKNKSNEDEQLSFAEDLSKRCCKVVKNVYKVYRDLSMLEEKYDDVASDDVMSMAIKPSKVLQAIRDLNPMYEGHLQHDAQEFLRCFLCYFQDAEKEAQKFCDPLPHKFSPKINPIMQRFLACSKANQDDKDKIVKIDNELSSSNAENSTVESSIGSASEKVKVNLFSKPEIKTETAKSPRKVQDTPKVGDTAGVVDEVNKKVTHVGACTETNVAKPDAAVEMDSEGTNEKDQQLESTEVMEDDAESELHDNVSKHKSERSVLRKSRRYKPYEKKENDFGKEKDMSKNKLACKRMNKKPKQKDENQLSITEGFSKTYSSKKRLGMRGAVVKKSAEELFDEVKKAENLDKHSDSNSQDTESPAEIEESKVGSRCDTIDKQKSSSLSAIKGSVSLEVKTGGKELDTEKISKCKSESAVNCVEQRDLPVQSYHGAYTAFLSALPDEDSDSVDTDSDSEDIVLKKKKEKELRNSPRRSPRKVGSEVLGTASRKFKISKLALTSKSESTVQAVKQQKNITDRAEKLSDVSAETGQNNNRSHNATVSDPVEPVDVINVKSENLENLTVSDSETAETLEESTGSSSVPMALVPVVKLENCDYILNEDGTSVSAAYATKCLTPMKNGHRRSSSSSNYLKQRNQPLSMDMSRDEESENAWNEMMNSPVKSRSKYDLIERTFQGTMMLRTQCLQCESSRERQEDFHDISVPVRVEKSDSDVEEDEDDDDGKCNLLDLIEASTEVEKLLEENKYFCEECQTYVEALRSVHYDVLPDILTLHLKRFSSETGNPSNITKINDHVDIPLDLPCLRYKCPLPCLRPDHRYRLYGIVTHSGVTLTSGHYLAYVRALPSQSADNMLANKQTQLKDTENQSTGQVTEKPIQVSDSSVPATRRKLGIATKLPSRFNENVIANTKVKAFGAVAPKKVKPDIVSTLLPNKRFDREWFECDDETVRVFDESDFTELLSEKSGSLLGTPYLLFYHKAITKKVMR